MTNLKNPVFVARKLDDGYMVTRDDARGDQGTVGFATFINVHPFEGLPHLKHGDYLRAMLETLWPSVGIGLETSGSTQYYFGLGTKMKRADIALNIGTVLGPVTMLPAGINEGDSITDPNILSTLPTQNKFGFFVGASFSFLGGGKEAFGRPWAGQSERR